MAESKAIEFRSDEGAFDYPGWRVALASGVGVFVSFASLLVYTFGIFLKPLTDEFLWSRQSASLSFGIAAIMVAVCSPPLGDLLDRFGPRRIILPCLTIFGCAFASLGLLTNRIWHLYAVFIILGIDTVLIAAAFCMYNRYVDGLATWAPTEAEIYREGGARLAQEGYVSSTEGLSAVRSGA
jgi:MFS family permease